MSDAGQEDTSVDAAVPDDVFASGMVGTGGGIVESSDGRIRLETPAGALSAPATITVVAAASAPTGAIGSAFEIGPSGLKFEQPVVLSLSLPDAGMNSADPASVMVGTVVDGKWQPAALVITDAESGRLHAVVDHFSIWAIVPRLMDPCRVDFMCSMKCC